MALFGSSPNLPIHLTLVSVTYSVSINFDSLFSLLVCTFLVCIANRIVKFDVQRCGSLTRNNQTLWMSLQMSLHIHTIFRAICHRIEFCSASQGIWAANTNIFPLLWIVKQFAINAHLLHYNGPHNFPLLDEADSLIFNAHLCMVGFLCVCFNTFFP